MQAPGLGAPAEPVAFGVVSARAGARQPGLCRPVFVLGGRRGRPAAGAVQAGAGPNRGTAGVGAAAGPGPARTARGARLGLSFHFQVIIVLDFSADVNFG